jgi:anti-anti-sigma factor
LANPPIALRLGVVEGPDATVVTVLGELDCLTAPDVDDLREQLTAGQSPPPRVIVDARHLQFVDVAGLDALLRLADGAESLELRNANKALKRLIGVLGLSERFGLPAS